MNDVDDGRRQSVRARVFHALLNVRSDDQTAHGWHETVMLVFGGALVFNVVFGFMDLPDIVIVGPDAGENRVLVYGFRGGLGKVPDQNAVMVRPRALINQFLEQGM